MPKAEAALNGKAVDEALAVKVGEAASAEVEPQDDIHASAAYRRSLTGTLTERALHRRGGEVSAMTTKFEVNGKQVRSTSSRA